MLSGSYGSAVIAAVTAFLLGLSGYGSFVGSRRDVTALQTKILNNNEKKIQNNKNKPNKQNKPKKLTNQQALDKANRRLNFFRGLCFVAWALGVVGLAFAVYLAAAPKPAVHPYHNGVKAMRECRERNFKYRDNTLISSVELSSSYRP